MITKTDTSGRWEGEEFANGVVAWQLVAPTPAYIAADIARANAPLPKSKLEQRIEALELKVI